MINQRTDFWLQIARANADIQHEADILDGAEVVGQRNSFATDFSEELEAAEFTRLDTPCLIIGLIEGSVIVKRDQARNRYSNRILILERFSVASEEFPSIPKSKSDALQNAFDIMQDIINKIQSDYDDDSCGTDFKFIDENSWKWESIEFIGSNLCGYELTFDDETNRQFSINPAKWL